MNSRTFESLLAVGIRGFTPVFRRQWVFPPIQSHPAGLAGLESGRRVSDMTFVIITSIISLLVTSLILAGVLQLASRVVNGQAIAYRDAFNATFGVLLVSNLLKMFLLTPLGFDEWWVLAPVYFLLSWIALACWVGLAGVKAALTAVVFMVVTTLIMLAFSLLRTGLAAIAG